MYTELQDRFNMLQLTLCTMGHRIKRAQIKCSLLTGQDTPSFLDKALIRVTWFRGLDPTWLVKRCQGSISKLNYQYSSYNSMAIVIEF